MYLTDCANKQGLFRIIQSIPSKKAEPFKLWLAKVGSERIDVENRIGKSILSKENYFCIKKKDDKVETKEKKDKLL